MNASKTNSGHDLPRAKTRKLRWRIPTIWVVPLAAAAVAGYLVYQRASEFGATVRVSFQDVEGLIPGQSTLKYRGADVGQVARIALAKDEQSAMVEVKLRRPAASLAREGSRFWVVRPQLGMGNLTGLGTIITGPYIAVVPGAGKAAREFVGLEQSPLMFDPGGLNVVLLTAHAGSFRSGVPVYYRGIEVGAVKEARLTTNATAVEVQCVIERRYARLVHPGSKFWSVAGLDLHVGLFSGAQVNVESLKSLIIGGIAFATPEQPNEGPARDGTVFRLYEQAEKQWLDWAPEIPVTPGEVEPAHPRAIRNLASNPASAP